MEQRTNKNLYKERFDFAWILTLVMISSHSMHFVFGVENVNHKNIIDISPGNNQDLIHQHTLPIANEVIQPSFTTSKSDNEGNLSPSFNNATSTQRHKRDLGDSNDENLSITENRFSYDEKENNDTSETLRKQCTKNLECGACIKHPHCAWCADPKWEYQGYNHQSNVIAVDQNTISCSNTKAIVRRRPRCDLKDRFSNEASGSSKCFLLENPKTKIHVTSNKTLTLGETVRPGGESEFVQISPQRINVKLRVGEKTRIKFKVVNAKLYPVDLYYLMDLSNSMSDDRETIVSVSKEIVSTMRSITNDFQIGFGSFVDKEVMPYISLVRGKNCQTDRCQEPYSYQHQMNLSSNAELFKQRVKNAPISGNIDNPEGGFDALMQVMVCDEQIGWRDDVRRVVIFTTDQSFHIAMDGKLGGIVTPNDGRCHLNQNGFYSHSKLQDYPSIGHINHIAQAKKVNVIWAVTRKQKHLYRRLTNLVEGSLVGEIEEDSSNIVELIRKQYQAITKNIRVKASSQGSHCNAGIINKNCGNGWEENKNSSNNDGICNTDLGTSVEFELEITLKVCKQDRIIVSPVGLADTLEINIEPICECGCEKNKKDVRIEYNDALCNENGKLLCGACVCKQGFCGHDCKCKGESCINQLDDPSLTCRAPYSVRTPDNTTVIRYQPDICSRKGVCGECGNCICCQERPGVINTGKYCEKTCDNNSCERDKYGRLCSGCGVCKCGKCVCGTCDGTDCYGDACECSLCKCRSSPDDPRICSGNGHCDCDECKCQPPWTGKYCDKCDTCRDPCEKLRACVECVYFNSTSRLLKEEEHKELLDMLYKEEFETWAQNNDTKKDCPCLFKKHEYWHESHNDTIWPMCSFKYLDCKYKFSYSPFWGLQKGPEEVMLHNLTDPSGEIVNLLCAPGPDLIGVAFGVIACIVAVGLVTILLWKAFTTIHDRKEFARFEQERENMKFSSHSNPIFKQATTTIQNPLFNRPE